MLTRTSRGVVQIERVFLRRKSEGEEERVARKPVVKVRRAMKRPWLGRDWQCQPLVAVRGVGLSTRYLKEKRKVERPMVLVGGD